MIALRPRRQLARSAVAGLVSIALLAGNGCGVRKETVRVSPAFQQAQTLSRDEVLARFDGLCNQPSNLLIRKVELTFSAESAAQRKREKLPSADAVLIVNRQGDLRMQIHLPMIKTTALDVVARGAEFEIWYPSRKTLYRGVMGEETVIPAEAPGDEGRAPRYNLAHLRPWHITQTFFHGRLGQDSRFALTQEDTAVERYYVIHELDMAGDFPRVLQKVWLERSSLAIRKKILYGPDGAPVSEVTYGTARNFSSTTFPAEIRLNRPREGYRVEFSIARLEADAALTEQMFALSVPADAAIERISPK
jgi:hypothetical protein